MMYGTREEFEYFECPACGTLQLAEFRDMAPYYPQDYLSFDAKVDIAETLPRRVAARFAGRELLKHDSPVGRAVLRQKPWLADHFPLSLHSYPIGLDFDSKILDLGCGQGKLLQSLHYFGFRDLTGADPLSTRIFFTDGRHDPEKPIDEVDPAYDL